MKCLLQADYIWLKILESLQSEAEDRDKKVIFKALLHVEIFIT